MITINIQKKEMYLLSAIIVFLVGVGIIIAYNSGADPSVMGHDVDEIDWSEFITELRTNKIITSEILMGQDNVLTLGNPQGSIVLKTPGTQGPVFFGIQTINPKTTLDVNGQISASSYCGEDGINCMNLNEIHGGTIVNLGGSSLPILPNTYYRVKAGINAQYYYIPVYSFDGYNPLEYEVDHDCWTEEYYGDDVYHWSAEITITSTTIGDYKYCIENNPENTCIPNNQYTEPIEIVGNEIAGGEEVFVALKDTASEELLEFILDIRAGCGGY